jgi:hypothetical protein
MKSKKKSNIEKIINIRCRISLRSAINTIEEWNYNMYQG